MALLGCRAGPKGGYGIFAARDASRSFVTGKRVSWPADRAGPISQHCASTRQSGCSCSRRERGRYINDSRHRRPTARARRFKDDLHDDVADFTEEQLQELARWRDFYAKHKAR